MTQLPGSITITGRTRVIGVMADPVAHSMSPPMHNRAFAVRGLDMVYVPLHVKPKDLGAAVEAIRALNLVGVNVTIPHKVAIVPHLDTLSEHARFVGAVNTVVNRDGVLEGHNTDGAGFVRSLRKEAQFEPRGRRLLILGAGGAAQAIAVQLALEGASELIIANRTFEKAVQLAELVERAGGRARAVAFNELTAQVVAECDAVVHTTSWGMAPESDVPPIIPAEMLHADLLVCDIVYTPRETSLLRAARERGCAVLPGVGMLVEQAALAFELWTGVEAPVDAMRETLEQVLAERAEAK